MQSYKNSDINAIILPVGLSFSKIGGVNFRESCKRERFEKIRLCGYGINNFLL